MNSSSSILLCTLLFITICSRIYTQQPYEGVITKNAMQWNCTYITSTLQQSEIETIIDLLLLSYQVAQASCNMILAKLTIQQELLKIHTPSLLDSWQQNLQIEHNDTTKLEDALKVIKQSQANIQKTYKKFKKLASSLVQMDPQPTQTLIIDLKSALIAWGKVQPDIPKQLLGVQNEFSEAIATISDIKDLFDTILQESTLKHAHLKEAASFFSKTYSDIELVIEHLTDIRKDAIVKLNDFFHTFFYTHYKLLYETITPQQLERLQVLSTHDQKVPDPNEYFAL